MGGLSGYWFDFTIMELGCGGGRGSGFKRSLVYISFRGVIVKGIVIFIVKNAFYMLNVFYSVILFYILG